MDPSPQDPYHDPLTGRLRLTITELVSDILAQIVDRERRPLEVWKDLRMLSMMRATCRAWQQSLIPLEKAICRRQCSFETLVVALSEYWDAEAQGEESDEADWQTVVQPLLVRCGQLCGRECRP